MFVLYFDNFFVCVFENTFSKSKYFEKISIDSLIFNCFNIFTNSTIILLNVDAIDWIINAYMINFFLFFCLKYRNQLFLFLFVDVITSRFYFVKYNYIFFHQFEKFHRHFDNLFVFVNCVKNVDKNARFISKIFNYKRNFIRFVSICFDNNYSIYFRYFF